ncbi:MAG: hypothetical protein KJO29_13000 [Bacteroidia bacterium]|nr:hypothetical protein [Bacteroidia bacterium]
MDFQTQHIKVSKTARYAVWGNPGQNIKYYWFVLHGSRMTCEQMIYKFRDFDPEKHLVIAPEGLNRFYASGFKGDVLSSWMTSRDRLHEIADFSEYLSQLYQSFEEKIPSKARKTILGFSQGATTAFRWLHAKSEKLDNLLAYAGWIPEDIDLRKSKTNLDQIKLIYTYGLQDPYLTVERIATMRQIIEKNQLDFSMIEYEGDHRIDRTHLHNLFISNIQ